jgi:DNA-binding response OmpR family regulator
MFLAATSAATREEGTRAPRVLVVEDDGGAARFLAQAFERSGEPGSTAVATSHEALDVARREPPDLVLLDLDLPGAGALDLVRQLRADGATARLPILAILSEQDDLTRVRALEAGVDGYLLKPVRAPELLAYSRALLRARWREAQPEPDLWRTCCGFLAHEVANKMGALLSDVQYAAEGMDHDSEAWQALCEAHQLGTRAVQASRAVVDAARAQTGQLAVRAGRVPLHELAREVAAEVDPLTRAACRSVQIEGAGTARADASLLRRVLCILVDDVVERGALRAATIQIHAEGRFVNVVVREPGCWAEPPVSTSDPDLLTRLLGGDAPDLTFCELAVAAQGGTLAAGEHGGGRVFAVVLPGWSDPDAAPPGATETPCRRAHPRIDCQLGMVVKHGARDVLATARNVSVTGAFLETSEPLAERARLTLRLRVPVRFEEIVVDAEVRWVERGSGGEVAGVGVRFDGMRARDIWAWLRYLRTVGGAIEAPNDAVGRGD